MFRLSKFLFMMVFCAVAISPAQDTLNVQKKGIEPAPTTNSFEYSCGELPVKAATFKNMLNSGIVLLASGVVLAGVGAGLIANANSIIIFWHSGVSDTRYNATGTIGTIIAVISIPLAISGTVFTVVGARKLKGYKNQQKEQNCRLKMELHPTAVELVYSF
jgi:hypothetical protein